MTKAGTLWYVVGRVTTTAFSTASTKGATGALLGAFRFSNLFNFCTSRFARAHGAAHA